MGLVVIILLGLSPSARLTQAVPRYSPRIQLVEDETPDLKRMTREGLSAELIRLEAARPSLVTPSVLLGLGLGLGAISLGLLFTFHLDVNLLVLGAALVFAVAVMLIIVGGITLAVLAVRRAGYSAQINRVQLRLDDLGRRARELPPPPSPNAGFFAPAPRFVLAVF